jgi:uncharacterized protein YjbI with pentapeptide repeats
MAQGETSKNRRFATAMVVAAVIAAALLGANATPAGARTPGLKKPSAPTDLVVVPTDGGGNVSWSPPSSDGGSMITGYTVTVGRKIGCSTDTQSCSVSGLINGKSYFIYVRASNAVGAGAKARAGLVAGQGPDCSNFSPGANLQYCRLKGADLAGDDLAGANFYGARLFGADLEGADLADVTLTRADINYVNLADTDLDGAVFDTEDPSLSDYIISGGATGTPSVLPPGFNLVDGYLVGPVANLSSADLSATDLSGQDLLDTNLSDADLSTANLSNADLTGANLDGADTSGTTFTGATWSNTTCPDGTNSNNDGDTCVNNLGT